MSYKYLKNKYYFICYYLTLMVIQLSSRLQYLLAEYDDHNSKLAKLLLKEVSEEGMPMKSRDVCTIPLL